MTPERQDTAGDIDAFPRVFPLVASFGALQRSSFCRLAERKAGTRTRLARIGLSLIITYVALHAAETLLIWPDWSGCRRTHIRRSTGHDGQFILNGRGGFHTHLASSRCCFVNDRRESLSDCLDIFLLLPTAATIDVQKEVWRRLRRNLVEHLACSIGRPLLE